MIALVFVAASCTAQPERPPGLEVRLQEAYDACMLAEGYPSTRTFFEVHESLLVNFDSVYPAQGTISADNANGRCVLHVLEQENVTHNLP